MKGFMIRLMNLFIYYFDYIEKEGYQIIGDAYEYEIHSYFTSLDQDQYLISLSIQVDKK